MATLVKKVGCLCACVIMLGPVPLKAAEPSSGWKAGVARVDTTPATPVRMAGYASRTSPSQGVAHPLAAKALALADAQRSQGRLRHLRHHRLPPCVHEPGDRAGQGQVWIAARGRRPVRVAQSRRPVARRARPMTRARTDPPREGFENNVAYTIDLENKIVDLDRRGARKNGAGQPVLRDRPRPLRPEPPRADRQRDQAGQEPRRSDR